MPNTCWNRVVVVVVVVVVLLVVVVVLVPSIQSDEDTREGFNRHHWRRMMTGWFEPNRGACLPKASCMDGSMATQRRSKNATHISQTTDTDTHDQNTCAFELFLCQYFQVLSLEA